MMMLDSRSKKILRDLVGNKARTILVVVAIAIGIFAFGSVFITQEILLKNLDIQYRKTNSSNITFFLSEFDDSLVRWIQTQDGVSQASAKNSQSVKLLSSDGSEKNITISSLPNYSERYLNLLDPKYGSWPPEKNEIILERNSLVPSKSKLGEVLTIRTSNNLENDLILSGIVYDNSAIPYTFTQQMTGFISWDTLPILGFSKKFNQLDIKSSEEIKTLSDAEKLSFDLTEKLKRKGLSVNRSLVFTPNEHWAKDNSQAFTTILSVIGVFSLILSGFLVINTISALLTQQKKQIGVMKAVGATQNQVINIYLITVATYGLLALFLALPIAIGLGFFFLKLVTDFLNLDINVFYLPPRVFLMQLIASLAVPVFSALIPIVQSSKRPVHSALSDFQASSKTGKFENTLSNISGLPRPILLALRNVFRKKARLAVTQGTLTIAGAVFMGVINVRKGMYLELERILQMFDFEISFNLSQPYEIESVKKRLANIPEITDFEARTGISAKRIKKDNTEGPAFPISGLPPQTAFSHPVILSGRWLETEDKDSIVLSSSYIRDNSDLSVGEIISIKYGENEKLDLEIAGIIAMSSDSKMGFMNFSRVSMMRNQPRLATNYLIRTNPSDASTQNTVLNQIVETLEDSNITVSSKETRNQIFSTAGNQFNFMIFFLLAMAVMIASVGGLGLAGTMSLNIMERTREIGIMRSIGAGNLILRIIVLTEGIIVGVISWIISVPLSIPITYGLCYAIGNAFFGRTLVFTFVPLGTFIWLAIIIVIASLASLFPAQKASKMSINETLAYE